MNDRRIVEAHKEASGIALRELEQFAATRIRKGGIQEQDRITGNLVGAAFVHTTSRALDPQLHTHFVLFNCTWDKTEAALEGASDRRHVRRDQLRHGRLSQ